MKKRLSAILLVLVLLFALVPQASIMAESDPAMLTVKSFTACDTYSMLLMSDNSLWTSGNNKYGQLGDETYTNRLSHVKIMEDVKSVHVNDPYHSANYVIKEDDSLWMWGKIYNGTIETTQNVPMKIADDVKSVSVGYFYIMFIKNDDSLWAWGRNSYGQLGDGMNVTRTEAVKVMEDVKSVTAFGNTVTMAIKKDNTLWGCGSNSYGQLGDGTKEQKNAFVKIMDDVESAFLASGSTMIIKTDKTLWGCGDNYNGRLGDGTTTAKSIPIKVMDDVESVYIDLNSMVLLKTDGSLWNCGRNDYGQLGDGTNIDKHKPIKVMDDVKSFSHYGDSSEVIKNDGSLWTWGYNRWGQLGDGTNVNKNKPVKIMEDVKSVYHKDLRYTYVTLEDDSLWIFGSKPYYIDMIEDLEDFQMALPRKLISDVSLFSASGKNILAIKKDSSLWGMGYSEFGTFGNGVDKLFTEEFVKLYDGIPLVDIVLSKISPTVASLNDGDQTAFVCTLRNNSETATSGTIKIEFYCNNQLLETVYTDKVIESDSFITVTTTLKKTVILGSHTIRAFVSSNEMADTNEENNKLKSRFIVQDD